MNDQKAVTGIPDLFAYTDYKKFIRDYYLSKKAQKRSFSYQAFASRAGFKSKASLANITCGKASLSKRKISDLANAMGLNIKETDFFDALVHFNLARTVNEREYAFGRMMAHVQKSNPARIKESQYEYYSNWYNSVVMKLVTRDDFKGDFKALAKWVEPRITPGKAKKALKLLLKLGMLRKQGSKYMLTNNVLTTGDEVRSLGLQKYHQKHLALAAESINRHPREIRDITSLTAFISQVCFKNVKKEIQLFRKRLMGIIANDGAKPETVYQIGMQLYPVSKVPKTWSENAL
jgi:uncharacterized protein (TIGR02147 family)